MENTDNLTWLQTWHQEQYGIHHSLHSDMEQHRTLTTEKDLLLQETMTSAEYLDPKERLCGNIHLLIL